MSTKETSYQSPTVLAGLLKLLGVAAAVFLGAMFFRTMLMPSGPVPTPAAFEDHRPLSQALVDAEGGPVLAYATADWCGPCKVFKSGALADDRFTQWVASSGVTTAYIDLTSANEEGEALRIQSVPTLIYFRDGREVARKAGVMSTDALLAWLASAGGPA